MKTPIISDDGQFNIVMLDDQTEVCQQIREALVEANITPYFASGYEQAIKFINQNSPAVILTDVFLGKDDPSDEYGKGFDLLQHVVNGNDTFFIPVIVYSGDSRKGFNTCKKAHELGAEVYIRKPYDQKVLVSTIMNIANRYSGIQASLSTQFIPKHELKHLFSEPKIDAPIRVALVASARKLKNDVWLKDALTSEPGVDCDIYETPVAYFEECDKQNIHYDAVIGVMPELDMKTPHANKPVATILYQKQFLQHMSSGNYDYYYYWGIPGNLAPMFQEIRAFVRNHKRYYLLKNALNI